MNWNSQDETGTFVFFCEQILLPDFPTQRITGTVAWAGDGNTAARVTRDTDQS